MTCISREKPSKYYIKFVILLSYLRHNPAYLETTLHAWAVLDRLASWSNTQHVEMKAWVGYYLFYLSLLAELLLLFLFGLVLLLLLLHRFTVLNNRSVVTHMTAEWAVISSVLVSPSLSGRRSAWPNRCCRRSKNRQEDIWVRNTQICRRTPKNRATTFSPSLLDSKM